MVLIRPGYLEDAPFASKGGKAKRTYVVRTMTSSFNDASSARVL